MADRGRDRLADAVHWRGSLRTRIALWSGAINVALLLLVAAATAWFMHHLIVENAWRDTRASALEAAQRLDDAMRTVAITTTGVSDAITHSDLDPARLVPTLRAMVRATPGAAGAMLAVEPRRDGQAAFARYVFGDGGVRDFIAEGYDYKDQAWYRRTLSSPAGWWSEPYVNQTAGSVWMVTYNLPVRYPGRGNRTLGMVSLDLPVSRLTEPVDTLAHLPGWQAALVTPGGLLAMHPETGVALHQTLGEYIARHGRSDLDALAAAVRLNQPAAYLHTDPRTRQRDFSVSVPVGDSGWNLIVSQSHDLIVSRLKRMLWTVAAIGALAAAACMLLARRLAGYIGRPVEQLAETTARLADGRYDRPVPHVRRGDEVGRLARTLEHARTSIQRQLAEIEEIGAARQKLESELAIARDIQLAMLSPPTTVARGPMRLHAHAQLEAAKAVGGDFYTFIERGEGELWFVVGDVSDKGVPAALFMARAVTVLEVAMRTAATPALALATASRRLVENNEACMFATVLCGRIDARSGRCELSSAGHDAPLLLRADGRAERPALASGPPLGFEANDDFPTWHGRLDADDSLVAWTDGVTEAFDGANAAFGEARLVAALRPGYSARENCARLVAEVHAFAAGAPQSDDITALAIRLQMGDGTGTGNGRKAPC